MYLVTVITRRRNEEFVFEDLGEAIDYILRYVDKLYNGSASGLYTYEHSHVSRYERGVAQPQGYSDEELLEIYRDRECFFEPEEDFSIPVYVVSAGDRVIRIEEEEDQFGSG